MIRSLIVLAAVFATIGVPAQASAVARNYDISLSYRPASGTVEATAVVSLTPDSRQDFVEFYLHDELVVSAVSANGKPLAFSQQTVAYDYNYDLKANRVRVDTGGRDLSGGLHIVYAGHFSSSKARSVSDYMRGDADGLYLRAYGYSLWFPVFYGPKRQPAPVDFSAVRISTPSPLRSVFTGTWLGREEKDGVSTETWRAKGVSLFEAQLTIRRFDVAQTGPLVVYYLDDAASVAAAHRVAALSNKLLAYYRTHYRAAAADRTVYVMQLPEYGDIASGNVVGIADRAWRVITPQSREAVTLAHELVHAFVQTPTPLNDWLYAFEIEGFPSYFHLPALGALLGDKFYQDWMELTQKHYLNCRATGRDARGNPVPPEKAILAMTPEDVGVYKDVFVLNDRALLFWDYLRRKLPAAQFDTLVRDLTTRSHVRLTDFFAIIRTHAPSLDADAHLWLETAQFPERFRRASPH